VVEPSGARVDPGLCGTCRHRREQRNARGSSFLRCALADRDPRFRRYPPLPVVTCSGHEPAEEGEPLLG
jgi:hypothetical protein